VSGLVTSWTGNYSVSIVVAFVFQLIGASLIYTLKKDTAIWKEIIYMLLIGIGFGCQMQNSLVAAQSATHKAQVSEIYWTGAVVSDLRANLYFVFVLGCHDYGRPKFLSQHRWRYRSCQ
jgi:hypothetical protein